MKLDEIKEVEISIIEKLESAKDVPFSASIFEVPECIRKGKEEFYTPSVVSIGPIHYKHPPLAGLASMQEMKLRRLERFLGVRGNAYTLQDYIRKIGRMEDQIRASYAVTISLSSNELIELVLLDASFIIYFIIGIESQLDLLPVEDEPRLLTFITQDLLLLENQLPFFVLEFLYDNAFPDSTSFIDLTCQFFANWCIPRAKSVDVPATQDIKDSKIQHLLDMLRIYCLPTKLRTQPKQPDQPDMLRICCLPTVLREPEYPMSASNLKASGVKFRPSKKNLLDISFKHGVLKIPAFSIHDPTKIVFQNLLAYEQCLHISDSYFMDYLTFLDKLVDTLEDVEILMKGGILGNCLGDNDKAVKLFNGMTINAVLYDDNFYYSRVCRDLNNYAKIPCHNWMAVLRRDYFSHPWAIISVIYAIILLILTLIQVIKCFK